ncbi:MAG: PAS domain S-box protein [Candidatus Marinimicrobia bacterium]|nr:PAS domain S-box protein [Candidatus Neomarinimicrobiota bacterium]
MKKDDLNKIMLENSNSGIFLFQDGEFIHANQEFQNILGYKQEELNQFHLFDQIHPDFRSEVKKIFVNIPNDKNEGLPNKFVFQFMRKNGKLIWLQLRPSAVRFKGDKALLGNIIDITDRIEWDIIQHRKINKVLSDEYTKTEKKLDVKEKETTRIRNNLNKTEKLALLGEFSGNISHELKNPLAVIDGSARYLQRNLDVSSKSISRHIDRIRRNVQKSSKIVNSIRQLENLEQADFEKLQINSLIKKVVSEVSVPDSIATQFRFKEQNVFIKGNSSLLEIAFKNIIKNAIDAMQGEGELKIGLKKSKQDRIAISFQDTGNGIPPRKMEKIFQPFYSTKKDGQGFGLHLVKKIIESHEGQIDVDSTPEEGTEFIIDMPYYYIV